MKTASDITLPYTCYLGLGSNLNNPIEQLRQALIQLEAIRDCHIEQVSSFYRSPPMGPQNQPHYTNAVASMRTALSPLELLAQTQTIELAQGRIRTTERWTARTLDLDILLYGEQVIQSEQLTIPHPGIKNRNFVLYPLREIAGELRIPQMGLLSELIAGCELGDLVKLQ